jgi:hypothetical protein
VKSLNDNRRSSDNEGMNQTGHCACYHIQDLNFETCPELGSLA